ILPNTFGPRGPSSNEGAAACAALVRLMALPGSRRNETVGCEIPGRGEIPEGCGRCGVPSSRGRTSRWTCEPGGGVGVGRGAAPGWPRSVRGWAELGADGVDGAVSTDPFGAAPLLLDAALSDRCGSTLTS